MTTKAVLLAQKNGNAADVALPYTSADLTAYNNPDAPNIEHVAGALDDLFQKSPGNISDLSARVDGLKTGQTETENRLDALEIAPPAHVSSHKTGGSDALTPANIGAVPMSRTITAGTGLSGGGNLSANRTLSVKYGTTAGTAAQGDDVRLSGGADWTASKPGIVQRVETLEAKPDPTLASIGAAPRPQLSAGVGQWITINSQGYGFNIPAGGSWAYHVTVSTGSVEQASITGIVAGGTHVPIAYRFCLGVGWRIV